MILFRKNDKPLRRIIKVFWFQLFFCHDQSTDFCKFGDNSKSPHTIISSSPIEHVEFEGLSFDIKREDLIHPEFGGNKWRKLKYNLERARHEGHKKILTFGGAWSNHIHATAQACAEFGFESIGVIRGEKPPVLSTTLAAAEESGMQLVFVSRDEYREKGEPFFKAWLHDELGSFYLVPEGGSNYLGVQGCTEILDEQTKAYDLISCACGTGATLAGLILSLQSSQKALGFSALKGGFMKDEVAKHLGYALGNMLATEEYLKSFDIIENYHFGGYAKTDPELIRFIRHFQTETGIALDAVYTGKMIFGLVDMISSGKIDASEKVLAIHTGGLQGNAGIEQRLGENLFGA